MRKERTILVVDDEKPNRDSMRQALEDEGYSVLEASNYWDALRTYQGHPERIDLLLTAIALPGNNGYELARSLSEHDVSLKMLFMSGPTGAEVSRFYNMPVSGPHLIDKPIQLPELVRRVNAILRSRVRRLRVQHAS